MIKNIYNFFDVLFNPTEMIYYKRVSWVTTSGFEIDSCYYYITKHRITSKLKLYGKGYKPKEHNYFNIIFTNYRKVISCEWEIRNNDFFVTVTLEEQLQKALDNEDYVLAEKIKKQINNK